MYFQRSMLQYSEINPRCGTLDIWGVHKDCLLTEYTTNGGKPSEECFKKTETKTIRGEGEAW